MSIPIGWKTGRIKDLVKSLDAGVSVNSEDRLVKNDEIGVLKVSAVSYGKFLPREHKVALVEECDRLTVYPRKNRILISRANTPSLVGASVYIDRDYPNLFLPDKLWQTEPRHDNFSIKWLSYLIASDNYRIMISSHATGTSMSMKNISKVDLLNIEIVIPPLREQCRIAEILGVWDESIDLLEKLITAKRKLKQGLMQQLLTGKKRFKEFGHIEWNTKTLESFVEKIVGGGTPSRENPDFWGDEIPWVTVKDFTSFNPFRTQEFITKEGLANSSSNLIPQNTVIIPTRMALGKAVIYKIDVSINQDLKAIFPKRDLHSVYLYHWLQNQAKHIARISSGSTVKGILLSDLKNMVFSKPSLQEQEKIAAVLSAAEISTLEKQLAAYKEQKCGLMQQLLTGRTRILGLEDGQDKEQK